MRPASTPVPASIVPETPLSMPGEVAEVARALRAAGRFAVDLEFMSEDRYVPALALVQVAWEGEDGRHGVALDPLAVDVRPVVELVGDASVETVLHSAQADLALLAFDFGIAGANIIDTQIAAAFLGMGEQIGYAPYIARTLGAQIDKAGQFTEWLRRPLSDDQLRYALDDVLFLLPAWEATRGALEERGRVSWVVEECMRLAESWASRTPPEEMYRRVSGWATLRPRQQGALRAVAAWREREALEHNRPPSRLLQERTMLELARRPPPTLAALRDVRGVTDGAIRRYGKVILDVLQQGMERPPPPEPSRGMAPSQAQVWAGMLGGLVQAYCRDAEIAARFVASRADVEAVAQWWFEGERASEPPLPVLQGWRRELVGSAILEWLTGEIAIVADADAPLGIRLVATPSEPPGTG